MASPTVITAVESWRGKLSKEYRNWLKVGQALSLMTNSIRPFTEGNMKSFQQNLLTRLPPSCACHCKGRHDFYKCQWAQELKVHHRGSPTWKQSNPTKWPDTNDNKGYWEIAKLYMPDLGSQAMKIVDAKTTDPTGLLNLIDWCTAFTVERDAVTKVRDVRNAWGHAPKQELSDAEHDDAFKAIIDFLQDPAFEPDKEPLKAALGQIAALKSEEIINFEEIENKILRDAINWTHEIVIAEARHTRNELQQMRNLIEKVLGSLVPLISKVQEIFIDPARILHLGIVPLWIFLAMTKEKRAVVWMVWLLCLQSLMILDDSSFGNAMAYRNLGCFEDAQIRAIPTLEGQDPLLNGQYQKRENATAKCYQAAKKRGFRVFAVQDGGWCASSLTAELTYNKYGKSSACRSDGEGGPWANQVYEIREFPPFETLGCFKDTNDRAVPTLEGDDALLDGPYTERQDATAKCYQAARKRGFRVFAVQNGGWCASSLTAELTYNKYGKSSACRSDGEGGPWANQVYEIRGALGATLDKL